MKSQINTQPSSLSENPTLWRAWGPTRKCTPQPLKVFFLWKTLHSDCQHHKVNLYLQKKIPSSPPNLQTSTLLIFYTYWVCKSLHKTFKTADTIMSRSSNALRSSHAHQPVLSLHCLLCQQEPSSVQGLKEEGLSYRQKLGKLSSHNQSWSVTSFIN